MTKFGSQMEGKVAILNSLKTYTEIRFEITIMWQRFCVCKSVYKCLLFQLLKSLTLNDWLSSQ